MKAFLISEIRIWKLVKISMFEGNLGSFVVFTFAISCLVWARFRCFTIRTPGSRVVGIVNDFGVIVIVSSTYYELFTKQIGLLLQIPSMLFHVLGAGLFWWAFFSAGKLDFASSPSRGIIITEGPFALVRHPFYLSYIIIWLGCVVIAPTPYVALGLSILLGVYIYSAVNEERMLLESEGADVYRQYQARVAMFFPKFTR